MIFKSLYPNVELPNKTITEAIFGEWDDQKNEKIAFINGVNDAERLTFGQFKDLSFKVLI